MGGIEGGVAGALKSIQIVNSKQKSTLQEALVELYLRLNGYFVSGFIVHSPENGKTKTELDLLAVRFPHACEPEREVATDEVLGVPEDAIDLVICEVKSRKQSLRFNSPLCESDSTVATLLNRFGVFPREDVQSLAPEVRSMLSGASNCRKNSPVIVAPDGSWIRGLLFSPERMGGRRGNQAWHITGRELFRYVSTCLVPSTSRGLCATRYDCTAWGRFKCIVSFIKNSKPEQGLSFEGLYEACAAQSLLELSGARGLGETD